MKRLIELSDDTVDEIIRSEMGKIIGYGTDGLDNVWDDEEYAKKVLDAAKVIAGYFTVGGSHV